MKEEIKEVKREPLDLKSLSVLGLSTSEPMKDIKPPSPKGQKKLKPWQKLKKTKSVVKADETKSLLPSTLESTKSQPEQLNKSFQVAKTAEQSELVETTKSQKIEDFPEAEKPS